MRVLIIEDEARLREGISRGLRAEGHRVVAAGDGHKGLRLATDPDLDVIVCDIILPGVNGFQICHQLRQWGVWTPVLVLTAKDGEWDEAEALDAGADDYLTKPFSFVVLTAHLRALVRRGQGTPAASPVVHAGDLRVDLRTGRCERGEVAADLSRREAALLGALLAEPGAVRSKADLLGSVWGEAFNGDPNIVEVYVGYLRRKLDPLLGRPAIATVRGAGYRFMADGPAH